MVGTSATLKPLSAQVQLSLTVQVGTGMGVTKKKGVDDSWWPEGLAQPQEREISAPSSSLILNPRLAHLESGLG